MLAKFFSGENFDPLRTPYSSVFWESNSEHIRGRYIHPYTELFFPPFSSIFASRRIYKTCLFREDKIGAS
ncbi:hypothetical protein HQ45_05310 [Porphyromonas crevioricanis]|uniref:Uncharacterized protein n=1 Tax=Porphyromonas crevioricanis JCM 15906 TaxID=1305617 RepID=T1CIE3_9PORP|nr:hypothetical protein HQ45_05310 [Porphyromonas crevioricanis]GAD05881.1 hypothetical protein PORCRE_1590 [Porphyromonas crevioricanis JCM 15906]GAD07969.1 hypothetical protein PORCAN_1599 [Porphyromonas crevioricanis JCM 13913]